MKAKNIFLRPENESERGYYEIWPFGCLHTSRFCYDMGFRYGLTLGVGTLNIMASTGVFVHVVSSLNRLFSSFPFILGIILI